MRIAQCRGAPATHQICNFDRIAMCDGVQSLVIYPVHAALVPVYRGGLAIDGSWDVIMDAAVRVIVAVEFGPSSGETFRIQLGEYNVMGIVGERYVVIVLLTTGHKISKSIRARLRRAMQGLGEAISPSYRQPQLRAIG